MTSQFTVLGGVFIQSVNFSMVLCEKHADCAGVWACNRPISESDPQEGLIFLRVENANNRMMN